MTALIQLHEVKINFSGSDRKSALRKKAHRFWEKFLKFWENTLSNFQELIQKHLFSSLSLSLSQCAVSAVRMQVRMPVQYGNVWWPWQPVRGKSLPHGSLSLLLCLCLLLFFSLYLWLVDPFSWPRWSRHHCLSLALTLTEDMSHWTRQGPDRWGPLRTHAHTHKDSNKLLIQTDRQTDTHRHTKTHSLTHTQSPWLSDI